MLSSPGTKTVPAFQLTAHNTNSWIVFQDKILNQETVPELLSRFEVCRHGLNENGGKLQPVPPSEKPQ